MKPYSCFLFLATALGGACAAPDTADPIAESAPPYEDEASSGGSSCTISLSCTGSGGMPGKCAVSPNTGALVCCIGCVDSGGYCRAGTSNTVCGGAGTACTECPQAYGCISNACNSKIPCSSSAQCDDLNPCTTDVCAADYFGGPTYCNHGWTSGHVQCGTNGWCLDRSGVCCNNGCNHQLTDGTYECVSPSCPNGMTCSDGFCI
jgi:hypothetical protein